MRLAKVYYCDPERLALPKWWILVVVGLVCLPLTGLAGIRGGVWKVYNDIPSLLAYMSVALLVYKLRITNGFFLATNNLSYEWYLVHFLVFGCVFYLLRGSGANVVLKLATAFLASYIVAYLYCLLLKALKLK